MRLLVGPVGSCRLSQAGYRKRCAREESAVPSFISARFGALVATRDRSIHWKDTESWMGGSDSGQASSGRGRLELREGLGGVRDGLLLGDLLICNGEVTY